MVAVGSEGLRLSSIKSGIRGLNAVLPDVAVGELLTDEAQRSAVVIHGADRQKRTFRKSLIRSLSGSCDLLTRIQASHAPLLTLTFHDSPTS
jgi:hypothetical protein